MSDTHITGRDQAILKDLAKKVAEIAADPIMDIRRDLWRVHNSLKKTRPLMLVFPEGAWVELIPEKNLLSEGEHARSIEYELRKTIYTYEHFLDDTVVESEWSPPDWWNHQFIRSTGWGVEIEREENLSERGSFGFKPILKTRDDLKKLHIPELSYDEKGHLQYLEQMHDLFGELLEVKKSGLKHISFHMMKKCTGWIGLEQTMYAMIDSPDFVHEIMSFLAQGNHKYLDQLVEMNLLSLNNDNTYQGTGGNGYTDDLPVPDFDADRVRLIDMWGSAESQEFHIVSPAMHDEFALQYEKPLLERFGLSAYGCCEDLSKKLDLVFTIPNIRRISISPFADVEVCAPRLKGDYIFSWKPQPAHLVGTFDEQKIRKYITTTLEIAKEHGNVLEIILKDTHTCEHRPERFDRWTEICRELIEEF